jgi:hypothetical protein
MSSRENISSVFNSMRDLVLEKNKRYGDSALSPLGCFSKLDGEQGIRIRLDDKLKRISNSEELRKNDVSDVMGYLALLCISRGWTNFDDLLD